MASYVKPAYFHHEQRRGQHACLVRDMALRTTREAACAEFSWAATRPDGRAALSCFNGPLLNSRVVDVAHHAGRLRTQSDQPVHRSLQFSLTAGHYC